MPAAPPSDAREFRKALGQFATGVTIVTARGLDGTAVGVTVSSFNSVSLDPPLVLWSLDRTAQSLAAFEAAGHFVVHVLALDQKELALQFAKRGADKFAALALEAGLGGCPLLCDCAARFHCEVRYRYEGGDHVIFVGEVKQFENFGKTPLIFHGGQFAQARYSDSGAPAQVVVDESTGSFGPDFTGYLVTRAHFQLYLPLLREMARVDLREDEYFTLSVLCIRRRITLSEIQAFLAHTGHAPTLESCRTMEARGLAQTSGSADDPALTITEEGRRRYIHVLVADRRIGERALTGFTAQEAQEFVAYLRRVIANTDPGSPNLWKDWTAGC